jgi:hypothetical protein
LNNNAFLNTRIFLNSAQAAGISLKENFDIVCIGMFLKVTRAFTTSKDT